MSMPFIGEIKIVGFNFAPRGHAFCNGQFLPISQNTALFSVLGSTYGGDGTTSFALPNLQGAAPLHRGAGTGLTSRSLGASGGLSKVALGTAQIPSHTHTIKGDAASGTLPVLANNTWGKGAGRTPPPLYTTATPDTPMSPNALSQTGGGQAHNNLSPYLVMNFVIALQGILPAE